MHPAVVATAIFEHLGKAQEAFHFLNALASTSATSCLTRKAEIKFKTQFNILSEAKLTYIHVASKREHFAGFATSRVAHPPTFPARPRSLAPARPKPESVCTYTTEWKVSCFSAGADGLESSSMQPAGHARPAQSLNRRPTGAQSGIGPD